jgi:hypothetical protein
MQEHVGYFQVPVNHIFFCEVIQSFEDILDDGFSPVLVEVSFLPQSGLEISLVAEFGDNVAVPVAGEDLIALEDVGVAELFEYIDLREK